MFSTLLHLIHYFCDIKFVIQVCMHFLNTITW